MSAGDRLVEFGKTEVLTSEELIVFAASHDLTLPPGTSFAASQLGASGMTDVVASLAARTLLCRGVAVDGGSGGEVDHPLVSRDEALDAMLHLCCEPRTRVVVTSGVGDRAAIAAFSMGSEFAVAQIILAMDVHVLRVSAPGELRGMIAEATQSPSLPEGGPGTKSELVLDRSQVQQLSATEPSGREGVLSTSPGWSSLEPADRAAIAAVLAGDVPTVSVLVDRVEGGDDAARAIEMMSWSVTDGGSVWRIDAAVPGSVSPDSDGSVVIVRSGRDDIEDRVSRLLDAVGVPQPA